MSDIFSRAKEIAAKEVMKQEWGSSFDVEDDVFEISTKHPHLNIPFLLAETFTQNFADTLIEFPKVVQALSEEVYVYGVQVLASDGEWRVASTVVCLAQDPLNGKWFPTSDEAIKFQEEIELKCATRLCRRRVSPIEEFVPGAKEVVSDEDF